jgi:hypothetical protein
MVHPLLRLLSVLLAVSGCASVLAQSAGTDRPEEIVVVGRVPGPPLWKVSNGDHVLWILPEIGIVPKDIEWETARVERLIAEAQEFISTPYGGHTVTVPLNPLSLARTFRIMRETTRLPDGQTLTDVLPPELYRRFGDLKRKYFPRDGGIEKLTPYYASREIGPPILEQENLAPFRRVMSDIDRFVRRNESLRRTDPGYMRWETVKPADLREMMPSEASEFPLELEVACLEQRIAFFERDLPGIRRQANAWAHGRADELSAAVVSRADADPCRYLPESMRDEAAEVGDLRRERWLAAAEAALTNNTSTFAVLGLDDLVAPQGLLAALQAKGYAVEVAAVR